MVKELNNFTDIFPAENKKTTDSQLSIWKMEQAIFNLINATELQDVPN